jgi:hypothetical protein
MKCIQAIKPTKNNEVGTVKRIGDVESESMVKSGNWVYVPKSTYKNIKKEVIVTDQTTDSVIQTKKVKKIVKK